MLNRIIKAPEQSFFLLGPRGSGKSTWLRAVFPEAHVVDLLSEERMIAASPMTEAQQVEATVAAHYSRQAPTYYIKAEGEIDVVVVARSSFVPIEVKWSGQLRQRDVKQLRKYPGALIVGQSASRGEIDAIPVYPLPLFLVKYPSEAALARISHQPPTTVP